MIGSYRIVWCLEKSKYDVVEIELPLQMISYRVEVSGSLLLTV